MPLESLRENHRLQNQSRTDGCPESYLNLVWIHALALVEDICIREQLSSCYEFVADMFIGRSARLSDLKALGVSRFSSLTKTNARLFREGN
jgi:hypothetical protein